MTMNSMNMNDWTRITPRATLNCCEKANPKTRIHVITGQKVITGTGLITEQNINPVPGVPNLGKLNDGIGIINGKSLSQDKDLLLNEK